MHLHLTHKHLTSALGLFAKTDKLKFALELQSEILKRVGISAAPKNNQKAERPIFKTPARSFSTYFLYNER